MYKSPAIVRDVPIHFITENDAYWDPNWTSLNNASLDIGTFQRHLEQIEQQRRSLGGNGTRQQLEDIENRIKQCGRIINEIKVIRKYFCEGKTIHPNQLIAKRFMPGDGRGLCAKRYILYNICNDFRRLIALRDSDTVGLRMSPVDFFRWRLDRALKAQPSASSVHTYMHNLSVRPDGVKKGTESLFRLAVERGAATEGELAMYRKDTTRAKNKEKKREREGADHPQGKEEQAKVLASTAASGEDETVDDNEESIEDVVTDDAQRAWVVFDVQAAIGDGAQDVSMKTG